MPSICSNCAKDQVLKDFILGHFSRATRCEICGMPDATLLDADDPALRSLIRALVRFYYSEWDYNQHWGGDGLDRLLTAPNPITEYSPDWNQEPYDDVLQVFFDKGYEDYDEGISLFAGYYDGGQLPLLRSLNTDYSPELKTLEQKLRTNNPFLLENEVDSLLGPHTATLSASISAGTIMHRARIGYELKAMPSFAWGCDSDWHYKPFMAELLGAPPPPLAGSGRVNRPGISFLYLATDEDTAICEVRPHPGHYVSVGTFESTRVIPIADFTAISIRDFFKSDRLLDQFLLLKSINNLLSFPVVPEDRQRYSFTQFLSDGLRRLGFEGIKYQSSVGRGSNVALFDASSFRYMEGSAKSVLISRLQYSYSSLQTMGQVNDYFFDGNGNFL